MMILNTYGAASAPHADPLCLPYHVFHADEATKDDKQKQHEEEGEH
jgi:hypothetical protein